MKFQPHNNRFRSRSFKPSVETLESRLVPVATVVQNGAMITITGSMRNEAITIMDNGLNSAGAIRVFGQVGGGMFTSTAVGDNAVILIQFNMLAGNDNVSYFINGEFNRTDLIPPNMILSPTGGRFIAGSLGAGNDQFTFDVSDTTDPNNFFPTTLAVTMASLTLSVAGNAGNDRIGVRYQGRITNGQVNLSTFGNAGDDLVATAMNVNADGAGTTNRATVDGGGGVNQLSLTMDVNARFLDPANPAGPGLPYNGSFAQVVVNASSTAATTANVVTNRPGRTLVI